MHKYLFVAALVVSLAVLSGGGLFLLNKSYSLLSTETLTPTRKTASSIANVPASTDKRVVAESYGKLPLHFEPNLGQTSDAVDFLARGKGYTLFLNRTGAVVSLIKDGKRTAKTAVRMTLENANEGASGHGSEEQASRSNYFIGSDPARWHSDVPNYARVQYDDVYPGVDLVYYGNNSQLEYDLVVGPNADTSQIKIKFAGMDKASIDKRSGDLLLATAAGTIRQHKPIAYQSINGETKEIASSYRLDDDTVGIALGDYDRTRELVIDPILSYGTYLGGNAFDEGRGITVDAQGNAYVVGTAASLDFPTTAGTIKPVLLPSGTNQYWYDAFVTKIDPTGTALVFSTYYGGANGSEIGTGVALDPNGNIVFTGTTMANDLPVVNAYQLTFGGTDDAFAAKINSTGTSIIYSTYLGGGNTDTGGKIAISPATGDTVFGGYTSSPDFPTMPGAFKEKLCDGSPGSCNGIFYSGSYVVKLSATGNGNYSTLFDASIQDVALDAADNATFGGSVSGSGFHSTAGAYQQANSGGIDGFIAKLDPTGHSQVYGTFLGGGLQSDVITGLVLDTDENIYVAGKTENVGFPTTAGAFDQTFNGGADGFVTKLNAAGSSLVVSTFLGGQGSDQPWSIALGQNSEVFVSGETFSPTTFPLRNSLNGTTGSIFLTHLTSDASTLVFSTLLGNGGAYKVAVDSSNNAYITGHTRGVIVTPNAFQTIRNRNPINISDKDAFVLKLAPTDENAVYYSISGIVTDQNAGYNNDYHPIVVMITGTVNRRMDINYSGGSYYFGALPAGGNYTITATKTGYETTPDNAVFNNLGANQSADFTILRNQPPEGTITSPAHGAVFDFGTPITIQATATDPDGDPIVSVDFVAYSSATGSIPIGSDATAPYETTWSNAPVGVWSLYAFPTDSHGLRGDSIEVVQISVVDASPISVSFIAPTEGQTFVEGDYVPIHVSVSASVNLVQVRDQNNNLVAWLTGSPWSSTWRVMEVGSCTLTATAQDSQNHTATATIHVTVNHINHRITGHISDSITSAPLPNVRLDLACPSNPSITATTLTDVNGNYLFTNLGTTPDDGVTITPSLEGYSFDPQSRSTGYLGYIQEWQNQSFVATRLNSISVSLTSPVEGQVFTAPANIDLAADASTSNGTITRVDFYRGPTLIGTDTSAPYEYSWTDVPAGIYGLFARATDSLGNQRDSSITNITVNPAVTTVRLQGDITNPGGGYMQGITVVLDGVANGQTIHQTAVSNYFGAYGFFNLPASGDYTLTPQGTTLTFTPPSASFTNVVTDIFDINFQASAVNQPPTVQINSPVEGAVYTMPAAIPVNATATDGDGNVVRLTLSAQTASFFTMIGETLGGNFSAFWQPNQPASYTIWATARDNGGLQTSVSIHITVNNPTAATLSGRAVDRNSVGIEGATVELRLLNDETLVASAITDATGAYSIPNIETFRNYILRASKTEYSFSPDHRTFINLNQSQTSVDFTGTLQVMDSDFDGDAQSDIAVWRPSTGMWYVYRSTDHSMSSAQFGNAALGDILVPGNYDGDTKIDFAVFRSGVWYIRNSSNGTFRTVQFGMAGDKPVPADYDGDGRTDIAVWRPSSGIWYMMLSSNGAMDSRQFGRTGDIPVASDYDGDGITDIAVWRPSNGFWYIRRSSDGAVNATPFGSTGDIPALGDYDGDKRTDLAVFRPSDGNWYTLRSSDGSQSAIHWGVNGDQPVPGDYDRDGKTDVAVFRSSNGTWYVYRAASGRYFYQQFGVSEDIPIPGVFVR